MASKRYFLTPYFVGLLVQLQQEKEALEKKVKNANEQLKKKEQENSVLTQSLAAVQAVNQASSDKISKVSILTCIIAL